VPTSPPAETLQPPTNELPWQAEKRQVLLFVYLLLIVEAFMQVVL
jgi:hypothetical protein